MAQVGEKLLRVAQNSLLEREHLEALGALEDYIQNRGRLEAFPERLQISPEVTLVPSSVQDFPSTVEELEEGQEAPEELVAAAVAPIDGLLPSLTKAARNCWELPASQVQLLVGAKPRGSSFSRYGFSFRPSGRHGQETP